MKNYMKRPGIFRKTVVIAAGFFMLFAASSALQADQHNWDGGSGVDSNWSSSANWVGDSPPSSSGDNLWLSGSNRMTMNNNFVGYSFADITMWPSAPPMTISGNQFTLTGTLKNQSGLNVINNDIILSGTPVFDLTNLALQDFTYNGVLSGSGNFYKTGTNKLYMNSAATYEGSTTLNLGFLYPGADNIFPDTTDLTINNGGKLMLESYSDTVASVTLNGGTITGSGTLTSTGTYDIKYGTIDANLAGTAGLTKSGSSSGAYIWEPLTYTGTTTVTQGNLSCVVADALPSSLVLVVNGGTFTRNGAYTAQSVTVESGTIQGGVLTCDAGYDVESGMISGGKFAGTGGLRKTTSGTFQIDWDSTYTGPTTISAGTLKLYASNALSDSTAVSIANGAVFDLYSKSDTVGSVAGEGDVSMAGSNAHLITGADNSSTTFSGVISEQIQPGSKVTKVGSGNWTLSGTNTYTGATTVSAGTLTVNGSIAGSSTTVAEGASLKGSGTVGPLTLNGTIQPGNSIGTMNINGNTSWDPGGAYEWEIDDAEGSAGSAPGWDLQSITGILDITATDISPFSIDITSLDGLDIANFSNTSNYTWLIASASGGVTNFAIDKFDLDYSAFTNDIGAGSFSIENDTNDINLKFTGAGGEVPEPSTFLLLLPLMFFLRRFYKKSKS
ncbi:autotransporter-associated beta strand repeat-containing protein [Candidatus Auribacterota bacterium]